jgi:radical SAM-linked protein
VRGPLEPGPPMPVRRSLVADLDDYPFPSDGPVGGPEAIFDRMSIEIARGCTEGCRFCQAGMIYRPVRERDPAQIVETVAAAVKRSGYDEVSLTALSTADFSCIAPLVKAVSDRLAPEKVSLGVSSLRAYGLEENVLDDMRRVRATGVTFAPEAGSQRMRDVVNKNVTEEQLMTTAERVFSRGWDSMKLYFMIGLPTEEEADVREIVRVGKRAREVGKRIRKGQGAGPPKVVVSVSTHVPKPHTPFQWCAMDEEPTVRAKQAWLEDEARTAKGVDLRMHDSRTSWLEGVFARGDRRLGRVLERAFHKGCRFDSWEDQLRIEAWEEAFREEGVDVLRYLGTIPVSARLPWDHVDVGLEEGFLLREYRKAVKSRLSPPCGKVAGTFVHHTNLADAEADHKKLVCYDCGVACDLSAMRAQRIRALRALGAKERREPPPPPAPPPPAQAPGEKRKGKKPPPRIVQGEPRRHRFVYAKVGPMAFLSHLDLIRALPRSFRRLGIPIFYSSGFHPKPDMTFSPALSLGVASLAEILDVKLTVDASVDDLAERLTAASPEGLIWRGAARLGPEDPGVSRVIDGARYVVGVPRRALDAWGGEGRLREEIERVVRSPELRVMRRFERGLGKAVDVNKFLRRLAVEDAAAVLEQAGVAGDLVPVVADVSLTGEGGVKIAEVLEAVLGGSDVLPYQAVRAEMGLWRDGRLVSPLELAAIRTEGQRKAPDSAAIASVAGA